MQPPTMTDVLRARRVLAPHLTATPVRTYPSLDRIAGTQVMVKQENVNPTCSFKVRGGLNLLTGLDADQRGRGVVGYSTGNHAQSLAYAAREVGSPCTIVMPRGANPTKAQAVRDLGAELVEYGDSLEPAHERAAELAARQDRRLVSAGNEPALIAGVATLYVELLEQAPDLDTVVVPVGSGSGAAAACLVTAALAPGCRVVAVQSEASPAAHDSWRKGEILTRANRTPAEGLATGTGFELTQQILRGRLDDFVLVDDESIRAAQWTMLETARTATEGAGAAALAAVLREPERYAGDKVATVCTGANASPAEIREVVAAAT